MTQDDAIVISPPARPATSEPVFVPKATTVVVVAALAVCVLVNAALLADRLLLYRAADGSRAALARTDEVAALTGLSHLAFLLTGVVFLRWLWQMRVNAEALAPGGHRMRRGWTTGAWLIPLACFVLPKRIMNDIWAAGAAPGRPRRTSWLLTSWWLVFVAAQLLASPAATAGPAAGETAGAALYVLAGALCIAVVLRLASMQRVRLGG
ncbi:DUF4328 domain-containing protein [Streptomyces sp. ME01-24h]|nr:DUF4328 domain-containing protein [Streptomyces sp. ME19-03-3]MDX3355592.1 DUF4328 domain-containing protein [Streptomyces sp. ME01-24h]